MHYASFNFFSFFSLIIAQHSEMYRIGTDEGKIQCSSKSHEESKAKAIAFVEQ